MSRFYALCHSSQPSVTELHLKAVKETEHFRIEEERAAIIIQSKFRSFRNRHDYQYVRSSITLMQRVFRGHRGRLRLQFLRNHARLDEVIRRHNQRAARIQAVWKGYRERVLRKNDFYEMKRYLKEVTERGFLVLQDAKQHAVDSERQQEAFERQQYYEEFESTISGLHHLMGTKSIAGVYRPPHSHGMPLTVNGGIPVEDALADSLKKQNPLLLSKKRLSKIRSSGLMESSTLKNPSTGNSLQASSKYDIVDQNASLERRVERKLRVGDPVFHPPPMRPRLPPVEFVSVGNPYGKVAVVMRQEDKTKRIVSHDFMPATRMRTTFDGAPILDSRSAVVKRVAAAKYVQ
eukprot:ANDGO_03137.mRNA.1 hypothetical protein NAEGRDRAFT_63921